MEDLQDKIQRLVEDIRRGIKDIEKASNRVLCNKAVRDLIKLGEPVVAPLIQILKENDNRRKQNLGSLTFEKVLVQRVKGILDAKRENSLAFSERIQKVFVGIGKPAVPTLIDALAYENEWFRQSIVLTLGKIGDKRALSALIKRLKEDEDGGVRWLAVEAIGAIDAKKAMFALLDAFAADPYIRVRESAAGILVMVKDRRNAKKLIELLKSDKVDVRYNAATILGTRNITNAITHLMELLKDDDYPVRDKATFALVKIISRQHSLKKLDELKIDVRQLVEDSRGLPNYEEIKSAGATLLGAINKRRNQLLGKQFDIEVDKRIKPRTSSGSETYRVQRIAHK